MKKKFFLIIHISIALGGHLLAQTTYNKTFDFVGGLEIGTDIEILSDGYLLCGTGPISQNDFTSIIKLVRLDSNCNVLWTKQYGDTSLWCSTGYPGSLVRDPFGNYYLVGIYTDTTLGDFLVAKIDQNGDSVWFRTFGGIAEDLGVGIWYDTSNHNIYAVGLSKSFGTGTSSTAIWVLDTMGITQSLRYYAGGGFDSGRSIIKHNDTIYVSGYTDSYGNLGEPYLMKLDTAGNMVDMRFYGTRREDSFAEIALGINSNKLVMTSTLDTLMTDGICFVSMLDLEGNIIWRRFMPQFGFINQARQQQDGSILLVGTTRTYPYIGNIARLDSMGGILWERQYYYNHPSTGFYALCTFYDFEIDTTTGSILAFGDTQIDPALGDSTLQDFWLVKLDSMGCLVSGCDTITDVGIVPLANDMAQVTVYPNPARGAATVLVNHGMPNTTVGFFLYDLAGKQVLSQEHSLNGYGFGEWLVDLEGLPQGIYLYRITQGGKAVKGKLVVE